MFGVTSDAPLTFFQIRLEYDIDVHNHVVYTVQPQTQSELSEELFLPENLLNCALVS